MHRFTLLLSLLCLSSCSLVFSDDDSADLASDGTDTGTTDTSTTDAGTTDAGTTDAGTTDGGSTVPHIPNPGGADDNDDCGDYLASENVPGTRIFIALDGFCYFSSGKNETYTFAENFCTNLTDSPSYLVEIDSANDNTYVEMFGKLLADGSRFWIGAQDIDNEGMFETTRGRVLEFENFLSSTLQPDNGGVNGDEEDCVEMLTDSTRDSTGTWNDRACTDRLPFICEFELPKED